jgi:two-component sensor histidine kinase
MRKHIEVGTGIAYGNDSCQAGFEAASQALSKIKKYKPTLVLLFSSTKFDIPQVTQGVASVTGDCPMVGTSGVREICQTPASDSVVVTIFASPHLSVEVGVSEGVSIDWERTALKALPKGETAAYFHGEQNLGRPYYFSHPSSGISPVFTLLFSPGMTLNQPSLSHEIHTFLRRRTLGRIPIVGGSSSSSDPSLHNYQIANGKVYEDAVVLAVVETDLLFGIGVAHGFRPTRNRAVVTRAQGHIVYELDDQPAIEACARLMGLKPEELKRTPIWFSRMPFGNADAYGQHHLLVPERVLEDGSIQFAPSMESMEAITLMEMDPDKTGMAAHEAVGKAMEIGHFKDPAAIVVFSCSLRHHLDNLTADEEMKGIVNQGRSTPLSGFLSFGEYGITDEGLPIYCNQSIVALVISNDLDKSAITARRNANLLRDIDLQLKRKIIELSAFRQANEVKFESHNWKKQLNEISQSIKNLTGAREVNFKLKFDGMKGDPLNSAKGSLGRNVIRLPLMSLGEHLGYVELCGKIRMKSLDIASSVCGLLAMGIHRFLMDEKLRDQTKEFETLHNIAREIVIAQDYRTVLAKISLEIKRYMGADLFSLWLDGGNLKPRCEESDFDDQNLDHSDLVNQVVESMQIQEKQVAKGFFLGVPLVFKEQLKGVLVLSFSGSKDDIHPRIEFLKHLSINLAAMIEIYELEKSSTLVREIHHRVKNNLQIIASLLNLQKRRIQDEALKEAIGNSIRRIMSIALVHETLCEKNIGHVDAATLVQTLSKLVIQEMTSTDQEVRVLIEGAPALMLSSQQATNLALILNELLNNALRHGLQGMAKGEIHICLTEENGKVLLSVRDNGKGLPENFDIKKHNGLGLQLISTIAKNEFGGEFFLEDMERGLSAKFIFPRHRLSIQ